uniref:Sulfatase N-terminal domain-containing protein n=2 Tax=Lotharella globosa TaxID=91324 RepID=A0A7S3YS59_9EUKA
MPSMRLLSVLLFSTPLVNANWQQRADFGEGRKARMGHHTQQNVLSSGLDQQLGQRDSPLSSPSTESPPSSLSSPQSLHTIHAEAAVTDGLLPREHNGGYFFQEQLVEPRGIDGRKPHLLFVLIDDFGWGNAGWHAKDNPEVLTPIMDSLVEEGIDLNRHYVYKYCSPTRSAIQTGRNPIHVNLQNLMHPSSNDRDPVSGFNGIPRNMTGLGTKMSFAGYRTHMIGKWDAGMATPDHTPRGRGYMSSLHYFHQSNNYWTQTQHACQGRPIVDLWRSEMGGNEGPAREYNSVCPTNNPSPTGDGCKEGKKGDHWYHGYEDALFAREVMDVIEKHDEKDAEHPLFMFWSPHAVHTPLQVPSSYLNKFDHIKKTDTRGRHRQTYAAMVSFLDDAIGNVTKSLKDKGMWEDTVMVLCSDNGGPIYDGGIGGANNYPLRGGKVSNFEGGIRVNAFVSGGYLPSHVRGTKYEGLVAGWDWYATFAELGGVDPVDKRAQDAKLPPIDSISMVDVILGRNSEQLDEEEEHRGSVVEPRRELLLGTAGCEGWSEPGCRFPQKYKGYTVGGVIRSDGLKLLIGDHAQAQWTGPQYPNRTSQHSSCFKYDMKTASCVLACEPACVFNVTEDPQERRNIANELPAEVIQDLLQRVEEGHKGSFFPSRSHKRAQVDTHIS